MLEIVIFVGKVSAFSPVTSILETKTYIFQA